MAKRTIKINIKLPAGIAATKELTDLATAAAQAVINDSVGELAEAQKISKELAAKGISITAEELMSRKKPARGRPAKKATAAPKKATGARKRTVLSNVQRKALIAELKAGAKITEASEKYGISTATVMNVKTAAGLTKKRK